MAMAMAIPPADTSSAGSEQRLPLAITKNMSITMNRNPQMGSLNTGLLSQQQVQEGKDQENEEWLWLSGPISIGAGLQNLGNTCYINSVLQCMTYTPPLANFFRKGRHRLTCQRTEFCPMCDFEAHVQQALSSSEQTIAPYDIVKNLSRVSQDFERWHQEDAHEYMRLFLDAMQKCCLSTNFGKNSSGSNMSLVQKIFGGCLRSRMRCTNCLHSSDTFDPFLDLSLDIVHAGTLAKALACFTGVEIIDGDDKYHCEKCQKRVRALKRFTIHKAPVVLTIQLKRFDSAAEKIDKKVGFRQTLDIKPFTSNGQEATRYRLYAVLVHSGGSVHYGHYFCYVQTSAETWHMLDDSTVKQVDEKTVLEQEAYMLFYCRESIFVNCCHSHANNMQLSQERVCYHRSSNHEQNGNPKISVEQEETRDPMGSKRDSSTQIIQMQVSVDEESGVMSNFQSPSFSQHGVEEKPAISAQTPLTKTKKGRFDKDIRVPLQGLKESQNVARKSAHELREDSSQASSPKKFTRESKLKCWKLLNGMPRNRRLILASSLPISKDETFETSNPSYQKVEQKNKLTDAKTSKKRKHVDAAASEAGLAEKGNYKGPSGLLMGHSSMHSADSMTARCEAELFRPGSIKYAEHLATEQIVPEHSGSSHNQTNERRTFNVCSDSNNDAHFLATSSTDERKNQLEKTIPPISSVLLSQHESQSCQAARWEGSNADEGSYMEIANSLIQERKASSKELDAWNEECDEWEVEKVRKGTQGARLIATKRRE